MGLLAGVANDHETSSKTQTLALGSEGTQTP